MNATRYRKRLAAEGRLYVATRPERTSAPAAALLEHGPPPRDRRNRRDGLDRHRPEELTYSGRTSAVCTFTGRDVFRRFPCGAREEQVVQASGGPHRAGWCRDVKRSQHVSWWDSLSLFALAGFHNNVDACGASVGDAGDDRLWAHRVWRDRRWHVVHGGEVARRVDELLDRASVDVVAPRDGQR